MNKSNRSHFDPSPAANHHFSHELFALLLSASAALRAAWSTATSSRTRSASIVAATGAAGEQEGQQQQVEMETEEANPLDLMAWLHSQGRAQLQQQGSEDAAAPKQQWNAYNMDAYKAYLGEVDASSSSSNSSAALNGQHQYNLFRTQQQLSSLHGIEELAAPRDW